MRSWVQTLQDAAAKAALSFRHVISLHHARSVQESKQSSGMAESLSSVQGKLSSFGARGSGGSSRARIITCKHVEKQLVGFNPDGSS